MVVPPSSDSRKVRKHFSADALHALVGDSFGRVSDPRHLEWSIPPADALMSDFAMCSLKDPSLLAFDQRRSDANLKAHDRLRTLAKNRRLLRGIVFRWCVAELLK